VNGFEYLKMLAENGNRKGEFVVAFMAENGIGAFSSADLVTAVRYHERCSKFLPETSTCFGCCLQIGRGIPIDFIAVAELLKRAVNLDDADGINSFGCCLEQSQGVDTDTDIDQAIPYYRRATSFFHPDGMYNFGRCLEYGKRIGNDLLRAVKYYRLSAEKNNESAYSSG
jgi:TPR repeat protein